MGALVLDFLHYVSGSFIWATYNWHKERQGTGEDADFDAPRPLNWPTILLFWAKMGATCIAYVLIIRFLYSRIALFQSLPASGK